MIRLFHAARLVAVAFLLSLVCLASALAGDTTVDATTFWGWLMPYVASAIGAVISFLVGWVLVLLKSKLGISIDDSMRDSLQTAATNAAGLLLNKLGNQLPGTIDVKNQFVADAVNYVLKAAPDAINHFGLTPDAIAQKIIALLPQVANTTTTAGK